jgi:hypothetical protein
LATPLGRTLIAALSYDETVRVVAFYETLAAKNHRVDARYLFLAYGNKFAYDTSLHKSPELARLEGFPGFLAIGLYSSKVAVGTPGQTEMI